MNALKKAVLIASLLAGGAANAAIISDYSKSSAAAAGWTIAYQGSYGGNFNYSAVLDGIAAGSKVALASSASGEALTFDLFAATSLSILKTVTDANTTIFADDAYWYQNGYSTGFAPNSYISQSGADVTGAGWGYGDELGDGDQRLSWHGGGNNVWGGWRSGLNIWLNSDDTWQRYVLVQADVQDVPEPASLALLGLGLAGLVAARRKKA